MNTKSVPLLLSGLFAGIALVLACSDDAPRRADAADASCQCPAAEAPITAERIQEDTKVYTIPANTKHFVAGVTCTASPLEGAIILTGGCTAQLPVGGDAVLVENSVHSFGWSCVWNNPSNVDIQVTAVIRCLTRAK
jgi:hypothetical protein